VTYCSKPKWLARRRSAIVTSQAPTIISEMGATQTPKVDLGESHTIAPASK
jgi:hypothetical protein